MTGLWRHHPAVDLLSPVLALQAGPDGIRAGGLGGVACFLGDEGWLPAMAGQPLRPVTALAFDAGVLLAGGGGAIARSLDGGRSWQACSLPDGTGTVTALALSPHFPVDGSALAATLDNGVLRSTDAGRSWQTSSFGLPSSEVLALAWGTAETVLAATSSGVVRSSNAGRAWRLCEQTADIPCAALIMLEDGEALVAPEVGPLLRSADNLTRWPPLAGLPDDVRVSALLALGDDRILLSAAEHGILLSTDGGASWSVVATESALCFAADETQTYAGTDAGVMLSQDRGETWRNLPPPPLHDLRRVLVADGAPLIAGMHSPPVKLCPDGEWEVLNEVLLPLSGLFVAPDAALLASTPEGLFRSANGGATWASLVAGGAGCVTRMTFDAEGNGWAGITLDPTLLRTRDGGLTWESLPSPFGVLLLVALQAVGGGSRRNAASLIAATYDARQHAVSTWRSDDGGQRWVRGADTFTTWPVVATCGEPPVITIGNVITIQLPDGTWRQTTIGEAGVLQVASHGAVVMALTGDGLWRSDDRGATWTRDDAGLPLDQLVDIALDGGLLFALLTGGRLWSRPM